MRTERLEAQVTDSVIAGTVMQSVPGPVSEDEERDP
jgi:hypothetical protein